MALASQSRQVADRPGAEARHRRDHSAYDGRIKKPGADHIPAPDKDARQRSRYATSRKEELHQLRHYYASVMLAGGVSVKELAEYLGHADPGFTLRVYAHMMPGSHDRARRAVDDRPVPPEDCHFSG